MGRGGILREFWLEWTPPSPLSLSMNLAGGRDAVPASQIRIRDTEDGVPTRFMASKRGTTFGGNLSPQAGRGETASPIINHLRKRLRLFGLGLNQRLI